MIEFGSKVEGVLAIFLKIPHTIHPFHPASVSVLLSFFHSSVGLPCVYGSSHESIISLVVFPVNTGVGVNPDMKFCTGDFLRMLSNSE
jgi:hypothetical protein